MIRLIRYEFIKQFCKRSILALFVVFSLHRHPVQIQPGETNPPPISLGQTGNGEAEAGHPPLRNLYPQIPGRGNHPEKVDGLRCRV